MAKLEELIEEQISRNDSEDSLKNNDLLVLSNNDLSDQDQESKKLN